MRRNLVSQDHLIGKESVVTLTDESSQRYSLAIVNVDYPCLRVKMRHCA